ncbi:MAG TPA: ABC transporter ATP-binding protein [Saprospiraceae bacterium]|nr:ABC transporter ATP-binding protein [Saprospiraceae bacterium]
MKEFIQYISQVKQYKGSIILYLVCYLFTAIFTVFSIPALQPLFEMLFLQKSIDAQAPAQFHGLMDYIQLAKFHFSQWLAGQSKSDAITSICILICAIFLFKNLARYAGIYIVAPIKAGIVRDTRLKLFKKFLALPLSYFSEERKGDLIARMTADVHEIEWTLLSTLESWVKDPLIILGSIAFMLYVSPSLTLFVLILLFVTSFIIGGISRTLKKNAIDAQSEFGELVAVQEESLGGIRVIKAFGSENYIINRFSSILNKYRDLVVKIHRRRELAPPMSEFLGIVIVSVLLWFGARLVFNNEMQASSFLAFLYAFFSVIEPSKTLSASYFNVQKGIAALRRINEVLDHEVVLTDAVDAVKKNSFDSEICFRNVSFKYSGAQDYVVKDINLTIKKGETIALVGASGSGKTTLVDLMVRFYDVQEGEILIDGVNIKKIKIESLRKFIGIVTQEAILFNDSIENNVLFGEQKENEQKVWSALELANAKEFVQDGDKSLDYNIGDRGVKLSGGQKQRLTIARALYRNPSIMVLDEATSSLDSASEKLVQKAMDEALKDRTAVVIAHRLSTIQKANRIYVLNEGRIIEEGTHTELLSNQGEYFKLVNLQQFG